MFVLTPTFRFGENNFVSLPDSISQLNLAVLFLEDCKRLEWLPKLPLSLTHAYVHGCPQLKNLKEEIWTSDRGFTFIHYENSYQIENSLISNEELFQMLYSKILEASHYTSYASFFVNIFINYFYFLYILFRIGQDNIYNGEVEKFGFECTRIPEWCRQQNIGYSTRIQLPLEDTGKAWMGFATFAVFQFQEGDILRGDGELSACFHFDTNKGHLGFEHFDMENRQISGAGPYGVWIYVPRDKFGQNLNKASGVAASISTHGSHINVYMCGMHIVFNEDMPDFCRKIAQLLNESTFLTYKIIRKPMVVAKFETPRGAIEFQSDPLKRVREENYRSNTESDLDRKRQEIYNGWLQYLFRESLKEILSGSKHFCQEFDELLEDSSSAVEFGEAPKVELPIGFDYYDRQIVAENALKVSDPIKWQRRIEESLEQLIEFDVVIALILKGHIISVLKPFHPFSNYNFCFPQKEILDWFEGHLNKKNYLKIVIFNNCPDVVARHLGARFLYQQDVEELKQSIAKCSTSFFDNLDPIRQIMTHQHRESFFHFNHGCLKHLAEIAAYRGFENENPSLAARTESNYLRKGGLEFEQDMIYDSCFPLTEILDWFGHQNSGSSVTIQLPSYVYSDGNWIGLALCAYFSDLQHSTTSLDQEFHLKLTSQIKTEKVGIESQHEFEITNEELKKLNSGEFIWVSYIPRLWFSDQLNQCSLIEASFASGRQELSSSKCGLRLLYQHDEEEFKQTISHCMALLSDSISDSFTQEPSTRRTGRTTKQPERKDKGYRVGRHRIKVEIPPNLNGAENWRGIAVYVISFSVDEHPIAILDHKSIGLPFGLDAT
ncbi:hypothetical protein FEM48_ZijujUnG0102200 [Ziziphus jujuba var. spinosa]|uniref:C-JID domain-containing protein n=1 Tax=Ziziphus jujuba var. spinosa TaxID=714518 RepID=A0A978U885_ZIZJJ|nr:hypothetical protein FEM48_ZijujUnG0102200 [Ziziphus jujuba var. spinosa]